ncbi:MAG: hypothetical protein VXW87_04275, partial [Pseudomonadota bacterium]|nr:hypothetical protein [Pseudomonadota bacterium]
EDQQKEICNVLSDKNKEKVKFEDSKVSKLNNPELVEARKETASGLAKEGLAKANKHQEIGPSQTLELAPSQSFSPAPSPASR